MTGERRQRLFLKIGCWIAVLAGAAHAVGQLAGPQSPANETERTLMNLMTSYHFSLPGGGQRTMMEFLVGFGWTFSLFMLTIGAVGLVIARRADATVLGPLARLYAASGLVMSLICLKFFFIVPAAFVMAMALSFVVAALKTPSQAA